MRRQEHVISLNGCADEETRQRYDREPKSACKRRCRESLVMLVTTNLLGCARTYISIVVLTENVKGSTIKGWLDVVELRHIGMLDRIN